MATPMTREDEAPTTIERRTSEIRDALTPCAARAEILPTGNPERQALGIRGDYHRRHRYRMFPSSLENWLIGPRAKTPSPNLILAPLVQLPMIRVGTAFSRLRKQKTFDKIVQQYFA